MLKAVILARSGSTRVKNKNIRPFCGSSLLEIKIQQLQRINNIDGIIVNSNDDSILDIAKKYNVEAIKRDPYFASNSVSINDVYVNMAENCNSDYIVMCNCTNPLISDTSISNIIDFYFKNENSYGSVNSANMVKEFMWLDGNPINYTLDKMPRSQDLPNILALNFAVNIISKERLLKEKNVVSSNPFLYEIPSDESVDVDWEVDFDFAEFLYNKKIQR